jgi:ssDNA-binding Zn-finger/Zn-ribbon topoisomerase 1
MTEQNTDNLKLWDALKAPPQEALKKIEAGRQKGKSNINAQWRLEAMTRQFGPCGVGWRYTIDKLWVEPAGANGEVTAFALVNVYIKQGEDWSEPIPGIGGNMLVASEKSGLHVNDECFKMAVTDALSVAFKALGVAADVYLGMFDDKYSPRSSGGGGQRRKREPRDEGLGECPKCGTFMRKVVLKDGSGRWFMGCQAYPDCKYTKWPDKKEKPEAELAATSAREVEHKAPKNYTQKGLPRQAPPDQQFKNPCPQCGREEADPNGVCHYQPAQGPSQPTPEPEEVESDGLENLPASQPEWRPQCCGRSMMPRAGLDGGAPFWSCPKCKKKRSMTEEERKRVGL